jgi:hypothetical protein
MVEVKIKSDKYGQAIGLLLRRGEGFQTRFEDVLIVTAKQCRLLEKAGLVEKNGKEPKARRSRGEKAE